MNAPATITPKEPDPLRLLLQAGTAAARAVAAVAAAIAAGTGVVLLPAVVRYMSDAADPTAAGGASDVHAATPPAAWPVFGISAGVAILALIAWGVCDSVRELARRRHRTNSKGVTGGGHHGI